MKINRNKKYPEFNWLIVLLSAGLIYKLYNWFSHKANRRTVKLNFLDFLNAEKSELLKWIKGRESFKTFCVHSGSRFEDYFIPYRGNSHKPKILNARHLSFIALVLILIKLATLGYLYLIYPDNARMADDMAAEIVSLVNAERKSRGIPELKVNRILSESALDKASDMLKNSYFAHKSPDGLMPWDFIERDDYKYIYVGENLAMNFSSAQSAQNALMDSPTHAKNILNSKYSEIGVAVLAGSIKGQKTNLLVQIFATREKPPLRVASASGASKTAGTTAASQKENKAASFTASSIKTAGERLVDVARAKDRDKAQDSEPAKPIMPTAANSPGTLTKLSIDLASSSDVASVGSSTDRSTVELLGFQSPVDPQRRIFESPNSDIEEERNVAVLSIEPREGPKYAVARLVVKVSQSLFIAMLAIVTAVTMLMVISRAAVHHKPALIHAFVLMLLIAGLVTVRSHIMESLGKFVLIT